MALPSLSYSQYPQALQYYQQALVIVTEPEDRAKDVRDIVEQAVIKQLMQNYPNYAIAKNLSHYPYHSLSYRLDIFAAQF